jgi:hypothetical protein
MQAKGPAGVSSDTVRRFLAGARGRTHRSPHAHHELHRHARNVRPSRPWRERGALGGVGIRGGMPPLVVDMDVPASSEHAAPQLPEPERMAQTAK